MQIEGNTLYIGGTFHQMMPFDNKLTHVGGCDLFVTALDKNSLEAQWTAQSGLDEGNGDTQHFNENFTSMTVNNGEPTSQISPQPLPHTLLAEATVSTA